MAAPGWWCIVTLPIKPAPPATVDTAPVATVCGSGIEELNSERNTRALLAALLAHTHVRPQPHPRQASTLTAISLLTLPSPTAPSATVVTTSVTAVAVDTTVLPTSAAPSVTVLTAACVQCHVHTNTP